MSVEINVCWSSVLGWPLSSSPDSSPWNDPAIVSTSQFTDSAGEFEMNHCIDEQLTRSVDG